MSLKAWVSQAGKEKVEVGEHKSPSKPKSIYLPTSSYEGRSAIGAIIPQGGIPVGQADVLSASRAIEYDDNYHVTNSEALKALPRGIKPARGPRARFYDPLSLIYATGFRDRRFSLTYDSLRRTSYQLNLLAAIVLTRVNQVAAFAQPFRENKQVGYAIRFKDELHIPTDEERVAIQQLEQYILGCGWGPITSNPYSPYPRDDFETFIKKVTRDSLTYDQMNFEVIPDQEGRPYEFRAVDAATIRLAATYDGYRGEKPRRFQSGEFTDRWRKDYGENFTLDGEGIFAIQLMHGRIENIYTYHDLAFCIRNARSDVWINGYGFAETEMALNTVIRLLWAEEYNARIFRQGSMANGIINFKGDQIDPQHIESFRRTWQAQVTGVENAQKIPIIQVPEGIEFVNMSMKNRDMEYNGWLEYLLKELCSVFQIDPSEINFDLVSGGGSGGTLFESKHEWKIKYSKDKGLRPLLRWMAKQISKYIIDPLDDRLYFDFVGLDQLQEPDRIQLLSQKVSTFMTINEGRREEGLEPLLGGEIINNPTFLQSYQTAQQAEADKQSKVDALTPWETTGDEPDPGYGIAAPIPLYLQEGIEEDASKGGQPPGGQPPGGGGGFPGM